MVIYLCQLEPFEIPVLLCPLNVQTPCMINLRCFSQKNSYFISKDTIFPATAVLKWWKQKIYLLNNCKSMQGLETSFLFTVAPERI